MFMGILPGGIKESDLTVMIEDQNWVKQKDTLTRASLIIQKHDDSKNQVFYSLLPFMSYRACELLDENLELRTKFHLKVCYFYKELIKKIYEQQDSVFNSLEILTDSETNIWACIY
jgi:hypothetical protein